jgi:pilus assembly protein CpaB
MRPLLMLVALVSAGAALWLWLGLPAAVPSQSPEAQVSSPSSRIIVLVASRELPSGRRLVEGDVAWAVLPPGAPREGLTVKDRMPDADSRVLGLSVQVGVAAGQPILWNNLASGDKIPLSTRIAPGKFAFSIVVSEATAAGGLILPGDRVDLLTTGGLPDQADQKARLLIADVPVLAVDQTMDRPSAVGAPPARTLTLELDRAALDIITAANMGRGVAVALRSAVPAP